MSNVMKPTTFNPNAYGNPGRRSSAVQLISPKQNGDTAMLVPCSIDESSAGSGEPPFSNGRRTSESQSSGRIVIPGFDASKYGKPPARRPSRGVYTTPAARRTSLATSFLTGDLSPISLSVNTLEQHESVPHSETSFNPHLQDISLPAASNLIPPSRTSQNIAIPPIIGAHDSPSRIEETHDTTNTHQAALTPNTSAQNGVKRGGSKQDFPQKHESTHQQPKTIEEKEKELIRLQDIQLTKIGYRNRHKRTPHTAPDSTSLRDLQLARTPLPYDANASITPRPEDVTNGRTEQHTQGGINGYRGGPVRRKPVVDSAQTMNQTRSGSKRTQANGSVPDFSVPNWNSATSKHEPVSSQLSEESPDTPAALNAASSSTSQSKNKTDPRWATPEELKPILMDINSNAWGSDVPSDASIADDDSTKPMHHGKLFRHNPPAEKDASLTGWDGRWQPPPVDWNDRPRFNNNSLEYRNGFDNWLTVTAENKIPDHGISFVSLPTEVILNLDLHPDGLDFVLAKSGVTTKNAVERYGYSREVMDLARHVAPLTDFEYLKDWGKLDLNYGDNAKLQSETTNSLVTNWMAQMRRRRSSNPTSPAAAVTGQSLTSPPLPVMPKPEINPHQPKVNIYLRPAVRTDIQQLTDLYNWYVLNGPRTTDLESITTYDMRGRFDDCMSAKLPFLVAVNREHKSLRRVKDGMEKIVGFALATDFAGANQAERISAELELYVDPQWLNKGVGKCLLDKLLDSTDRGHIANGGYPFTCDPESMHCYNAGGGRDLTMLIFMVRHFKNPNPRVSAENDFNTWIKKWLVEQWDFEESGCLKGVGTKFKRLTNITYLCKETKWQPIDGHVPEPLNTS